jgi:hypothetical protein
MRLARFAALAILNLALLAAPRGTEAQSVPKTARIDILWLTSTPTPPKLYPAHLNTFFEGFRERGWVIE